jgi:hypothetical protein
MRGGTRAIGILKKLNLWGLDSSQDFFFFLKRDTCAHMESN